MEAVMLIKEKVKALNNPQLGALGERIFVKMMSSKYERKDIFSVHSNKVDFRIDGVNYDVKTNAQNIEFEYIKKRTKPFIFHDVRYPLVYFLNNRVDLVFLDNPDVVQDTVNYDVVLEIYNNNKEVFDRIRLANNFDELKNKYEKEISEKLNKKIKAIQRSCQDENGASSFNFNRPPDNFFPNYEQMNNKKFEIGVVFFFDAGNAQNNIKMIFAYPLEKIKAVLKMEHALATNSGLKFNEGCEDINKKLAVNSKKKMVEEFQKHTDIPLATHAFGTKRLFFINLEAMFFNKECTNYQFNSVDDVIDNISRIYN
jgi:hypothetical protein